MADRGGVRKLKINGDTQLCKAIATIRPSDHHREAIIGACGYQGTAVKHDVPGADVTITDRKDLDVKALQDMVDGEVIIELYNGKTYTLIGATVLDQIEISPEEGEVTLVFGAEDVQEIKNS